MIILSRRPVIINIHRVNALIARHLMSWPRSLERLADAFWWPTINLLIWGFVTVYLQSRMGGSTFFVNMFLGGLLLWTLVVRSQEDMGITLLQEAWDRNILNMFTAPLTIWEFSVATICLASIKLLLSFIWMFLLAWLIFSFNIFSFGWILIPFAIVLMMAGWSLGFIINGLIMQFGYRVQVFAWTLTLAIMPFSAVYYPVSALPTWMQTVSRALPTSYIFEGMRLGIQSHHLDFAGLGIAFGLDILYLILGMKFFSYSYRKAQKSGMIMKFS